MPMEPKDRLWSPTKYPKAYSYKNIVNAVLNTMSAETAEESASNATTPTTTTTSSTLTHKSLGGGITVAPDFAVHSGDKKYTYHLQDGGKLVRLEKTDGRKACVLLCVDGRRVFIERTESEASLIMTDPRGRIVKSVAAQC